MAVHPDNPDEKVVVVGKANMTGDREVPAIRFRVEKEYVPPSTWELPVTCPLVTCPNPRAHKADTSDQGKRDPNSAYVPSPERARKQGMSLPILDEEF